MNRRFNHSSDLCDLIIRQARSRDSKNKNGRRNPEEDHLHKAAVRAKARNRKLTTDFT